MQFYIYIWWYAECRLLGIWGIFSVLLRWAIAIKVWANAIKMPDQHKYDKKLISASYKMFRRVIEILTEVQLS